jgi:hypothetical protein
VELLLLLLLIKVLMLLLLLATFKLLNVLLLLCLWHLFVFRFGVSILSITLCLLQCQGFLKLLRCTHAKNLQSIHGTHDLISVVGVKHHQQVAHPAALWQREGLGAAAILCCEATQQLPG